MRPRKIIPLILLLFFVLACTCAVPTSIMPAATQAPAGVQDPAGSQATATTVPPVFSEHFTLVRLSPADGDLGTQLAGEAPKAAALGQHMFVEFDAAW